MEANHDDIYSSDEDVEEIHQKEDRDASPVTEKPQDELSQEGTSSNRLLFFHVLNTTLEVQFVNITAETINAPKRKTRNSAKKTNGVAKPTKASKAAKGKTTTTPKATIEEIEEISDDSDHCDENPTKKKKTDARDAPNPSPKVTAYINITSFPPQQASTSKAGSKTKKNEPVITTTKGPFFFFPEQSYVEFRSIIAKTLPCKLSLLPTELFWKYEKPANDPKKVLSNPEGYEALILSLNERKSGHVLHVFMSPPKADDSPWDTGLGDHVDKPYNHDEEIASHSAPEISAKGQIAMMKDGFSSHLQRLMHEYPVGNVAHWPQSRTLLRVIGDKPHYWELSQLRLQVWANHLALGKAGVTLYVPPANIHFDIANCLKLPKTKEAEAPAVHAAAAAANANAIADQGPPPPPPQAAHHHPQAPPAYAHPYNMPPPHWVPAPYMYPPPMPQYAPFPYGQPGAAPGFPHKESPASSPGTAMQLRIPLANFCSRYDISKSDEPKLALLEYIPGNNAVLTLAREDWKEVDFSSLGWQSFLAAHKRFVKDVKDGLWVGL